MQRPSQRQQAAAASITNSTDRTAAEANLARLPTVTSPTIRNSSQVVKTKERKRIFISGVNSLVGHALFEQMRNDHEALRLGKKSHKFSGTVIKADEATVPSPNDQIKIIDGQRKPKTFGKTIISANCVVIDLVSGTDLDEAEKIIQILRQPLHEYQTKR